jgi:hypothetical protein
MEQKLMDNVRTVSEDTLTSDGTTCDEQSQATNSATSLFSESRNGSKCDEEFGTEQRSMSDADDDDEDGEDAQDDYYAFLREMAGSFEADCEDDESEVGSDSEGSSDEEEAGQIVGRKRSSSDFNNGLPTSPQFVGRGRAHGAGTPEEECKKVNDHLARQFTPAPLEHPDRRAPVIDDYDVTKAVVHYASGQPALSSFDRQRQEIGEAIQLRTNQANNLNGLVVKHHLDPELRSNYARVRSELLAEVRALEEQLQSLVEAQQQPTQACAQEEAHQEMVFAGHANESPGVVVH